MKRNTLAIALLTSGVGFSACTIESGDSPDGMGGAAGDGDGDTTGDGDGDTTGDGDGDTTGDGDGDMGGMGGMMGASIGCDGVDLNDAHEVTEDITEDTTWEGTIYVSRDIDTESGATLTIEPGTNIIMAVDTALELGWNSNAATIMAVGTEDAPIRFCGETAEPGYWDKVIVGRNVTSNSVFSHVYISDAGGEDTALRLDAPVLIEDVLVSQSGGDGVWAIDFEEDSSGLTVEDSADAPVVLLGAGAITNFPLGGDLGENADPLARIRFNDIEIDTTYHDLGIPYLQELNMDVESGARVEFDAGVEYRFDADTGLEVGWNSNDARIVTNGTESDPVVFRGASELAGFWHGLQIRQNVRTDSRLSYTEIWHGGGDENPALLLQSPITIDHVTLSTNETGMRVEERGFAEDSTDLSITQTEGAPLIVEPNALVTIPTGGDYTENDDDQIEVEGGDYTTDGTVPNVGVPYYVRASIDTETDSVLTLVPGTHFIMSADTSLEIGWNSNQATIVAEGTEEAPIVFSGADDAAGHWIGMVIGNGVVSSSSLDYVEIHDAGGGSPAAALVLRNPITVTNSTFANSAGWGILKEDTDTTDYVSGNSFADNASGTVSEL